MVPDSRLSNFLPNEGLESFWDALWLGIGLFLCSGGGFEINVRRNYGGQRPKSEKWTPKVACRRRRWVCWGMWWPKLAQVGGLGAFAHGRTHFHLGISSKLKRSDPQRTPTGIDQGSTRDHAFGSNAPRDAPHINKIFKFKEQGMTTGSNTPWAKGPANFPFYANEP